MLRREKQFPLKPLSIYDNLFQFPLPSVPPNTTVLLGGDLEDFDNKWRFTIWSHTKPPPSNLSFSEVSVTNLVELTGQQMPVHINKQWREENVKSGILVIGLRPEKIPLVVVSRSCGKWSFFHKKLTYSVIFGCPVVRTCEQ